MTRQYKSSDILFWCTRLSLLIVNLAEYLSIEISTKVSSEPLSWKPPCAKVTEKAETYYKLCGEPGA